jgi:hypothetical protein
MALIARPKPKSAEIVPDGTYQATLSRVFTFENTYGERIGFEFTLRGPNVEGATVTKSSSPNLSPKSKLADMARGVLGRELTRDEFSRGMDLERLIGADCAVLVLQTTGRQGQVFSNVERVYQPAAS